MTVDEAPWQPDPSGAELGGSGLFPELASAAYLAHAAVSVPSLEVRRAVSAAVSDFATRGVSAVPAWNEQRARLKTRLARLIAADAREIALVPGTTRGVIDVALSLPWKDGDRVVCFEGEFPTNVTPWQRAAETFHLELALLDAERTATGEGLEDLERLLRRGVRLVAMSAVQFQTGLRMPLEEVGALCRRYGAELFVDAIQACGVAPLDVGRANIDYLTCGSHKWLMGLSGAGFVYVRGELAERLVPRVAGWLSHEDPLRFLFEPNALRYDRPFKKSAELLEQGAPSFVGFAALEGAVACIEALGVEAIAAHVQRYHDAIEETLEARGFTSERRSQSSLRSGILSFRPREGVDLRVLSRELDRRGVVVSIPDGRLRLAPHWPNALREIEHVLHALDSALG
ncbi:MAG: aminotransferase class V-fold PLP-dependent enzyme [Sandaracinaceae bacterium]|nr:aminotransferase class V-fold PLP-dependent enzyme [Sandaracinaceae bacterium]